VGERSGNGSGF
jgi:vacuolar-type H+-ATPase catalytic subunit A/Vma1